MFIGILLSYLTGCIPSALIITKLTKGLDIRSVGSGNVGATNVLRTAGKTPALIVLAFDIFKGIFAVGILPILLQKAHVAFEPRLSLPLFGLAVVCGHIWNVFLKFKGGKGVATGTGVVLILAPKALLAGALVWGIVILATKYVSLSSICASITLPLSYLSFGRDRAILALLISLAALSIYKHKSNIYRLLQKKEPKIGQTIR